MYTLGVFIKGNLITHFASRESWSSWKSSASSNWCDHQKSLQTFLPLFQSVPPSTPIFPIVQRSSWRASAIFCKHSRKRISLDLVLRACYFAWLKVREANISSAFAGGHGFANIQSLFNICSSEMKIFPIYIGSRRTSKSWLIHRSVCPSYFGAFPWLKI